MVCISQVSICNVPEFVSAMNELAVKIVSPELFNGTECLSELCFESTYSSQFIPVITKITFMVLLWLILHLFYSLIPGEI